MTGTTVDTLELFEEFKQTFTVEQARALSKALKRVEATAGACSRTIRKQAPTI